MNTTKKALKAMWLSPKILAIAKPMFVIENDIESTVRLVRIYKTNITRLDAARSVSERCSPDTMAVRRVPTKT